MGKMAILGSFGHAILAALLLIPSMARAELGVKLVPGKPVLALAAFDLASVGYSVEEFFISGTASSYKPVGDLGGDGRWTVAPAASAPFTTRIVVVRPSEPSKFNGTVVVEWLNVSIGMDVTPDWSHTHRELIRSGYAYVGVSAQKVGVVGGGMMSAPGMLPLKKADPERYGPLDHPGDAYAMDMFTQVGTLLKGPAGTAVLGSLVAKHVLATGESQSAGYLTTYVNAIAPTAKAFDGYLIHSRFGGAVPVEGTFTPGSSLATMAVKIRTDLSVPVLTFITETDLVGIGGRQAHGYLQARQPDSDRFRAWEVAGTAHADTYLNVGPIDSGLVPVETLAKAYAPTSNVFGMTTGKPINAAPQHHYVMQAAMAALNDWVVANKAPPHGSPISVTSGDDATFVLDQNGNVKGGIRSPWMDVPTARLSGIGQTGPGMGALFGVTESFDSAKLAKLYPGGRDDYLRKFDKALQAAVKSGFILKADMPEIHALAAAMFLNSAS